jgi:replicative DNA helicase
VNQETLAKLPPQSLEAEESVLGAMLLDRAAIDQAVGLLKPESFYRPAHRMVFEALRDLNAKNEPCDLVTVSEHLRRMNELEAVGGTPFLAGLLDKVPSAANAEYYAKIVRDKQRLRNLISACSSMIQSAYEHREEASLVLDTAENRILEISREEGVTDAVPVSSMMEGVIRRIEEFRSKKGSITGLATGFKRLDEQTSGFQRGDMVVVAGRPGMGKTAFCMNIARNVAVETKKPVAIFSLEMTSESLAMRLMCAEQRVNSHAIRTGRIENHDLGRLTLAASKLYDAPLFLDDTPKLNIHSLRSKVRRLWKAHGIELVVVDYLQLLESDERHENRQQEITFISRGLKAIAKETGIPVLVASQLSRASEQRGEKSKPRLSDLRESGAIEQDADTVLLLYREGYYTKDPENKVTDVDIAKQRSGPTGEFQMIFHGEYTRFDDAEFSREPGA